MSSNHIFRYVIFGLGLFYTYARFDKSKARCKDCTEYSRERCPIEGDSGYYVAISSKKSTKDASKSNPLTDDLDVCIPSSINVDVSGGTFQYICIWSSELGCQLILPESDSTTDCSICQTGNYFEDMGGCPCKTTELDTSTKKSGSGNLNGSYLCLMITAFLCSRSLRHLAYMVLKNN
ncbi:uncharacterized protein LOC108135476 [Drosophila elegans]|uniref:uncharacterized protein LOC108135476 n=1 Tax=Drosophila elegans TaxID=30023 RepID=UPI0007E6221F|nr:uncharacterized protein LOC108135476 [Drosophila elegans]